MSPYRTHMQPRLHVQLTAVCESISLAEPQRHRYFVSLAEPQIA